MPTIKEGPKVKGSYHYRAYECSRMKGRFTVAYSSKILHLPFTYTVTYERGINDYNTELELEIPKNIPADDHLRIRASVIAFINTHGLSTNED
jgi:hypothetical protein